MEELHDANSLPSMPSPDAANRAQTLESLASTLWTLTFISLSSSTVLSEFPSGPRGLWTVLLVAAPPLLASADGLLSGSRGAAAVSARYALYAAAPAAALFLPPLAAPARDALAFAALWLPLELGVLPPVGTGRVAIWASLTAALGAVNTFGVLRPFAAGRSLGYTYKIAPADLGVAVVVAALLAAVVVVAAFAVGYGRFVRPRGLKLEAQAAIFFGIYFVAVGEELLFRGIAQNLLERQLGVESTAALVFAALMFGSAQLKSKGGGHRQPNWRAALLGSLTGVGCGLVWRWTGGKTTASAITQAGVSYTMRLLFMKRASL